MKAEQIIDEMQASLTKLRGHYRKTGTAGEDIFAKHISTVARAAREKFEKELAAGPGPIEPCQNYPHCINKAIYDSGGYPSPEILDEIHKLKMRMMKDTWAGGSRPTDRPTREHILTPDLPLHARVVKALGKELLYQGDINGWRWRIVDGTVLGIVIPDYPNDPVAAMGALEEYCDKKKNYSICYYPDFSKTLRISIWDLGSGGLSEINVNCPLPQAICEVIVKHAEGNGRSES